MKPFFKATNLWPFLFWEIRQSATTLSAKRWTILEFHSDNGSEYINRRVAALLQKLFIEFTKSRSRHSNDNALVESKNASIVRKVFSYTHIPQKWAQEINQFNRTYLNTYKNMITPYEKLKSLPHMERYLKPEITLEILDERAMEISDNEAADRLQQARKKLFCLILKQDKTG